MTTLTIGIGRGLVAVPRIQFRDEADRFVELVWSSSRRGRAVFHHDLKGNAPFRPCLRNSLLQRLTLAVRRFRVFVRRLRMGLGLRGFLTPFRVLSLAMLVGGQPVAFRRDVVVFGRFVVCFLGRGILL
jgi:hypothetical protein